MGRRAAAEMAQARRSGRGAQVMHWQLSGPNGVTAETVLDWCRDVLAKSRRPFGIDRFDLAVACLSESGRVRSERFLWLEPAALYAGELAPRIVQMTDGQGEDQTMALAAALFSWGEAANRALPDRT